MFSPPSSTLGSDTSLLLVLVHQEENLMILSPVVFPTPLASAPYLFITTQLTRPTYTFRENNYMAWASGFELFL